MYNKGNDATKGNVMTQRKSSENWNNLWGSFQEFPSAISQVFEVTQGMNHQEDMNKSRTFGSRQCF